MFDTVVYWLSFVLTYVGPAVVFGLTAMAWQRYPCRPFFLLSLSSMLTVLAVAGSAIMERNGIRMEENLHWWRCQNILFIIDAVLFPWSLVLIFRFIRDRDKQAALTNPGEQPPV